MAKEKTNVYQEMESLGIERKYFDKFYEALKNDATLPKKGIVPVIQYKLILNYLIKNDVVGVNEEVDEDGLVLFDNKLKIEDKLGKKKKNPSKSPPFSKGSGGLVPCKDTSILSKGSGGIMPCKDTTLEDEVEETEESEKTDDKDTWDKPPRRYKPMGRGSSGMAPCRY